MRQQTSLIKGTPFDWEEEDSVEFKEVISSNPVKVIANHAERYITAFLNALIEGNLYFGINDDGIIVGVALNRTDRDSLQKDIPNKLKNTDPPLPYSCYKITIHNVLNQCLEPIEDLYIIQIHTIKPNKEHFPYRTSKSIVYYKKGSSCPTLNSEEITQEIKRRTLIHVHKEANEIDKELKKDPENIIFLKRRAEIAKYMSDINTMDRTYKKLLEIDPKNPDMRIQYATAYENIGDLEGALSILDDALQSVNDKSYILESKGSMLMNSDYSNKALYYFQEVLKLNPDDYTTITKIGILFRQLGEYKKSIQFLNYALSKSPNYRVANYEKKKTYSEIFKGGIH